MPRAIRDSFAGEMNVIPSQTIQVLALRLHNRSIPMLAHETDNLPVGGLDAARTVTTVVIVLCLLLLAPAPRGRSWKPELAVPRIVAQAQAHRAIGKRPVTLRGMPATPVGQVR